MRFLTKPIIVIAMILLSIVSVWTTYKSLTDSILPEPLVGIPLPNGIVWQCSVFAFLLSGAIGMMLFALKMAIIDDQKRLNVFGLIGMSLVASISIAFNMDVLYRTAKKDFYLSYSYNQMRSVYDSYLSEVQTELAERKASIEKGVAKQEGELDAEVKGLRAAPQGYGTRAKEEDYKLTVLSKTAAVDLAAIEQAIAAEKRADELLAAAAPQTIQGIQDLQNQLRVAVKDAGAVAGLPLPPAVQTNSPLFAVFSNLMDWKTIGLFEVFILVLAFLLDLGDIVGYSLVPNKPVEKKTRPYLRPMPDFMAAEVIPPPSGGTETALPEQKRDAETLPAPAEESASAAPRRGMSFRRRR
ncbi:MAG: hypothetical protein RBU21_05075 [FCB group bacterium]|jgi:hypothetical protein|nr:hypothetical protein [FCB group bacterium]